MIAIQAEKQTGRVHFNGENSFLDSSLNLFSMDSKAKCNFYIFLEKDVQAPGYGDTNVFVFV